jgi:glycine cleavage system H protein
VIDGYEFPEDLWYHAREHLWLRPGPPDEAGRRVVTVGVDALGAMALGDVVYVQLAEPGRAVGRGEAIGSLEAEKMVRPVVAPVSGTLLEVNGELLAAPRLLNTDCYGRGWAVRIRTAAWESESGGLLHDPAEVAAWARAEIRSHEASP